MIIIKDILKELDVKLELIKRKKGLNTFYNGCGRFGLSLEKELGISINDFSVPDINGIEIKTQKINSKYPMSLFNATCDGPDFYELNRLVSRFGACYSKYNNTKVLYIDLSAKEYSYWGRYLKMKLEIDYTKKKIFIVVANANGKLIEKRAYWNFSNLEESLNRKLKYLCYIQNETYYSKNKHQYKLSDVHFCSLKNFDKFISLIESGDIVVNIKYGVYKSGVKKGKSYNHGTSFRIKKDAIFDLFDIIK